jgi:hypothetical protein
MPVEKREEKKKGGGGGGRKKRIYVEGVLLINIKTTIIRIVCIVCILFIELGN